MKKTLLLLTISSVIFYNCSKEVATVSNQANDTSTKIDNKTKDTKTDLNNKKEIAVKKVETKEEEIKTSAVIKPVTPVSATIDTNLKPMIEFEQEVINYGTITNGSDGARFFKIKNIGNAPLTISRANGSCGCTVPQIPTEPIMPGQTAEMKVTYDTKRMGSFNKSVTVNSNAVNAPVKTVRIQGTVAN